MDWENERYIRVYTRDTSDLLAIGHIGRAVWWELLRKVDRAGVIELDDPEIMADLLRVPVEWWNDSLRKFTERRMVELSHDVTACHTESHDVTLSLALPSLAKRRSQKKQASQEARDLANYLADAIRSHSPKARVNPSKWEADLDHLIKRGGRQADEIRKVIDFVHRSENRFWRPNILSGGKLREKFDALEIQSRTQSPSLISGPRGDYSLPPIRVFE